MPANPSGCCGVPCGLCPDKKLPKTLYFNLINVCPEIGQGIIEGEGGYYYKFPLHYNPDSQQWEGEGPGGCGTTVVCETVSGVSFLFISSYICTSPNNWTGSQVFSCDPLFVAHPHIGREDSLGYIRPECGCMGQMVYYILRDTNEVPTLANIIPPS